MRKLILELKGAQTQDEFAKHLGLRQQVISLWLIGAIPSRSGLLALARAYPERTGEILAAAAEAESARKERDLEPVA